ncbi:DUF6149 family protein [Candidatus Halobonum tyrrellensis]|uniref:Uncharacterized protein n=1 Tax=Candidatus Halobonum tyrrellensis G22 TaxID=1324957 RepID=V4HCE4_9EURY|nr:DUF6149 family protein [Candidatus Halobonum tyrrellensis]ESP88345.1 hypothetical protein K933_09487 [Candidatus Halobonum tyrrellensis G22]
MKIRQNARHWATKKALTTPGLRSVTVAAMVRLHTSIFLDKADEARREERRDHLDDFFEATMDTYVAALEAGFPEAEAREVTHAQANFDFFNHGWVEMMEIPDDELEEHYRRYERFFELHGITIDDPLGEFRPADGIADAPATPDKRADGAFENAVAGFSDDVYVEDETGEVSVGGGSEPADVDVEKAVGVADESRDGGSA